MKDFREFLVAISVLLVTLALLGFSVAIAIFFGYEAGVCLVGVTKLGHALVCILVTIGFLGPLLFGVAMANKLLEEWLKGIEL